jgi:GGDEF domain-containing protein
VKESGLQRSDGNAPVPGTCWIGFSEPPFPVEYHLTDHPATEPPDPLIVFVDGNLADRSIPYRLLREWLGRGSVPWIVIGDESTAVQWLREGAWGVLSPDTLPETAIAFGASLRERVLEAGAASPLTGLPGNATILRRLEEDVIDDCCSAAYIDITGFKPFNDYYGFARGDAVLRNLALLLQEHVGNSFFTGHLGGDDFICIGRGEEFFDSVAKAASEFRARAPWFYTESDRAAGGIEALDRHGEFRFYPILDLTVALVSSESGTDTVEDLAEKASLEKRRAKGELSAPSPSVFMTDGEGNTDGSSFLEWYMSCPSGEKPDTRDGKALLEAAGIADERDMTACLVDVVSSSLAPDLRKSAALSLGMMEDPEAEYALTTALGDRSPHVRTRAVEALARIGGQAAGPVIAEMTSDPSTWVRRAALRGIGVSGWLEGLPLLSGALEHDWRTDRDSRDMVMERKAALHGAILLGDPSISSHLSMLWAAGDYRPRRELLEALYSTGTEAAAEIAAGLIAQRDGKFPGALERLRLDSLRVDTLRRLEAVVVSSLKESSAGDGELLELLARFPLALTSQTFSVLKALIGGAENIGVLLETLLRTRDAPDNSSVSRAVTRVNGMKSPERSLLIALVKWASRGKGVRPGLLLPFLRDSSREVSTAAARAVLILSKRWVSPDFDRTGESLHI